MSFHSKKIVVFLFCLISIGQAYPLSLAWSLPSKAHSCCCTGVTKPCDCDHASHGKKVSCHRETQSRYAANSCGQKTEFQILSFQGDPFLPDLPKNGDSYPHISSLKIGFIVYSVFIVSPEAPPPKSL